jgi:nitrate reductase cytochrome c-type subunit
MTRISKVRIVVAALCAAIAGSRADAGTHATLTWTGYEACRSCHPQQANDVFASGHYQWNGNAPYNVNNPSVKQGKYLSSINSYCVNVLGNWDGINAARAGACSACHVGRGLEPSATSSTAQLDNIDCLICHQDGYKRKFDAAVGKMVPDTAAMTITLDQAVQTIHRPTRASCLQCHAKAGGGDAVKRGDITLAHTATTDGNYDVHMSTARGNLKCTSCHTVQNHRIAGSGSDLRVVDLNVQMKCTQCHTTKSRRTVTRAQPPPTGTSPGSPARPATSRSTRVTPRTRRRRRQPRRTATGRTRTRRRRPSTRRARPRTT